VGVILKHFFKPLQNEEDLINKHYLVSLSCIYVNKSSAQTIRLLPLHSGGVFRPHLLGKAKALVGLNPNAGRTDLYLQRQGKLECLTTSQHFALGFGGYCPVTAA